MFGGVMEMFNLSGSFLSHFVIAFILLLKKPPLTSGRFSVIGPAGPIQISLGGEAELVCYLSPPQNAQHMEIVWLQSTQIVHLYRDGKDHFGDQDPDYQGRMELVRDGITNGNVTLKIWKVRLLDAGRYMCLFEDDSYQEEAELELKILGEAAVSQILPPLYFFFIITFLIVMYLYFLFDMLRIQGFDFDETSLWKEWKFGIAIILLVITKLFPYILQKICYRQQRHHHRAQPVSRT